MMKKFEHLWGVISLSLAVLEMVLIVVSWIISAAMPELHVRSLLSSGGIRWFFGNFTESLCTPLLINIILLMIGVGSVSFSGLASALIKLFSRRKLRYFERIGLYVVGAEIIASIIVVILLTAVPHAILLSVTGHLFPSSFSRSLIAIISFIMLICSLSYGFTGGRLNSAQQIFRLLVYGIIRFSWVLPIYILASEFVFSLIFVFYLE